MEQQDLGRQLTEIESLDLSFLKSKFLRETECSEIEFEAAQDGLKRFFLLALQSGGPFAVTSKIVDELWHTFILFTPQYREFCNRAFGFYLDHQTNTPATPVPAEAFRKFFLSHEALYGRPDDLWLRDLPADIQAEVADGRLPSHLNFQWSGWPGRK